MEKQVGWPGEGETRTTEATPNFRDGESLKVSEQNAVKGPATPVTAKGWTVVEAGGDLRQCHH